MALMEKLTDVRALIDLWPTRAWMARKVGANGAAVQKWHTNNRIPAVWHQSVIAAAKAEGFEGVTAEWMVAVHDRARLQA